MINIIQLTNQPVSKTSRTMIDAIRYSFDDVKTFADGKPAKESEVPRGLLDYEKADGFSLFKNSQAKDILAQIPQGETVILTDFLSPKFLPAKLISDYNFIHVIGDLPPDNVRKILAKVYLKSEGKIKAVTASKTIKENLAIEAEVIYPPFLGQAESADNSRQSFVLGVVSRLLPNKGIESLIQAVHKNREMLPQLNLIIIGDGPEKKRLLWLIEHLHLKRTVQLVSMSENCERFIKNFDAYVAPDPSPAGWDSLTIHALASGVPVIAGKSGIYEEIIRHGSNGLLFEAGNSHILSQHILNLYNNPDWMQHYKKTGPAFVRDRLSFEVFKKKLTKLIG